MEKIVIRSLTSSDIIGVAEIKVNGWKTAYKGIIDDEYLNSLSIEEQAKKFEKCIGNDNFVVAIQAGKVVGFCRFVYDNSFSPNIDYADCELTAIYVHPDFKSKGIGTELFQYVLDKFNNQDKSKMILWCLADNINSINFYKHMGGEIQESKQVTIGDINYEEVGIVYNVKELCNKRSIKH